MPREPIPKDPVYMSYATNHHVQVVPPTPQRSTKPYRPATQISDTDLELESARGVYPHFHAPFNDHSRYLAEVSGAARTTYRDLPRQPPPPWDGSPMDYDLVPAKRRPSSAPPTERGSAGGHPTLRLDLRGLTLVDNMVTSTGRPCYTESTYVEADMETGNPVMDSPVAPTTPKTKVATARVQTYMVAPSVVGYGSGGVRPFHQDYRHYKYFGFAGCGAKTSWAHNPKYSRLYAELLASSHRHSEGTPGSALGAPTAPPLQETMDGPRRELTEAERVLVGQFRWHNYASEGVPSDPKVTRLLAHVATGQEPTPRTLRHLHLPVPKEPKRAASSGGASGASGSKASRFPGRVIATHEKRTHTSPVVFQSGQLIEPYNAKVDLHLRKPIPPGPQHSPSTPTGHVTTRVTTYTTLSSPYAAEINRSPNHGSQSPWHQRYAHYKYAGFAGKGATSSWARNPKYAVLTN